MLGFLVVLFCNDGLVRAFIVKISAFIFKYNSMKMKKLESFKIIFFAKGGMVKHQTNKQMNRLKYESADEIDRVKSSKIEFKFTYFRFRLHYKSQNVLNYKVSIEFLF